MGMIPKQVIGLVQLAVLLLSFFKVLCLTDDNTAVSLAQAPHYLPGHPPVGAPKPHKSHHHHHHHHHPNHTPPAPPPVKAPSLPPVRAPSPPPAKLPSPPSSHHLPERRLVAVQGVVYCKSCKYIGIDTLTAAIALANATVRLVCTNTKYHLIQEAKTDKNGYFFILPTKVTTAGSHKCKVFLVSSPLSTCNKPTDLHAGHKGAILMPNPNSPPRPFPNPLKFHLFTVGPFAFEPSKKCY